jgi:hypothetical protein
MAERSSGGSVRRVLFQRAHTFTLQEYTNSGYTFSGKTKNQTMHTTTTHDLYTQRTLLYICVW